MGRRKRPAAANDQRVQLGPFWLWYRAERDEWCICWYDDGGPGRSRRTCRKATGICGRGEDDQPPQAAQDALADHYAEWRKPVEQAPKEALVEGLMADWLLHVEKTDSDPVRAGNCITQWLEFFETERRSGRITRGPYVSDVTRALCQRYIDWRKIQPGKTIGSKISGATISRELAALRASLRWAWQNEVIASAPFIPDIDQKDKPGPKDMIYTPEQIARLLEAAMRIEERRHVHLFIMIMLSTHGRGEAILELDADTQIRDGLIYFNAPGRAQTKKRRSIVPIAPTLAPWLEGAEGKVIQYRTQRWNEAADAWETITKPTSSIKTAFEACLVEAGICEQAVDAEGNAIWLEPRRKLGESSRRPKLVGIGSPNTLRHTISTELHTLGVPEAQIDAAAGHAGTGTNKRNYRHLRPGYLKEFVAGVEDYWAKVGQFTTAHLRSQCDPKVVNFASARAAKRSKNG